MLKEDARVRIPVAELVAKVVLVRQARVVGFIFPIAGGRRSMGGLLGKLGCFDGGRLADVVIGPRISLGA